MRISSKLQRSSKGLEPKSKYYIIPEGEKTEIQYFCGIRDNAEELNIKPLIEIIPIENDENEYGQSHPKRKIRNFNRDLNDEKFIFDKEIDKVYFVIDRDPQNFSKEQLDEFILDCEKYGYEVCLSNPTFELFLVMHDDKVLELDKIEMFENRKKSRNRRFLELQLSSIFGCSKKSLNFEKFKPNIRKAINNEKNFCEDLQSLKTQLGSNVGRLLDSIIEE